MVRRRPRALARSPENVYLPHAVRAFPRQRCSGSPRKMRPRLESDDDPLPLCGVAVSERGAGLNLPNLITIARILLVPVIVWAIGSDAMLFAFILFLAAG